MVGDQEPGMAGGLCLLEDLAQSLQEMLLVGIGFEHLPPFDAPAHDVMEQSRRVDSGFARHESFIPHR